MIVRGRGLRWEGWMGLANLGSVGMGRGWRFYGFLGLVLVLFWVGVGWYRMGWHQDQVQVGLELLSLWVFLLGHDATIPRKCFLFRSKYEPNVHFQKTSQL